MASETETGVILEKDKRLSESIIWQIQQNYYRQQGVDAWRKGVVPHYVTSNPFIAGAYARVARAFVRDCQEVGSAGESTLFPPFAADHPLYVVELGAGSGRFSYHFLKKFFFPHGGPSLESVPVKYIMTDISPANLKFWQAHASLKPLVEAGLLDFALFNVGQDQQLKLAVSGQVLSAETVKNPLIIIANYLFDTIPQDCFYIKKGQLHESLVTVSSSQAERNLNDPALIKRVKLQYRHRPITANYYTQPDLNRLLGYYRQQLDDTTLLFPRAALDSIRQFSLMTNGRLLLLSADKGYAQEEALAGWRDQVLTVHGSFSMMVNYHAIEQFVRNMQGRALHTGHSHYSLNISAFLLGQHLAVYPETQQAYQEAIDTFGPDDFFVLKEGVQKNYDDFSIAQLVAFLRLSGWDADIFFACCQSLLNQLKEATSDEQKALVEMAHKVWDTYYPLGEIEDVPFQLGMVLYTIGRYEEAMVYFQHSLEMHGPHPSTSYNIGLCYYGLQQLDKALEYFEETLDQDSAFEGAMTMWREVKEKLG